MIRLALEKDIEGIMAIVAGTITEMHNVGNDQWNHEYPLSEHFLGDIEDGTLYVWDPGQGPVKGFICIDEQRPDPYNQIEWSDFDKVMIIHRMAVASSTRGEGIGSKLMLFAEDLAREKNIPMIHSDTYSVNVPMNRLFDKLDYTFVGPINMLDKSEVFHCYEKKIF